MEPTCELLRNQYFGVVFFVQHLAYYRGLRDAWASLTHPMEFWVSTTSGHLRLATVAWCNVFGSRKEDMHWTKILESFKLTEQSLGNLREEEISDKILEKLQAIQNLEIHTKYKFLKTVEEAIGHDQNNDSILKHVNRKIDEQSQQDFRRRVLSKTGFTKEKWETYHKNMLDFRNKYVEHYDLFDPFNEAIPEFDPALKVAYAYQEWVKELIKSSLNKSTVFIWDEPAFISRYEELKAEASNTIL